MIKFLKRLFKPKICNHPFEKGYIVKCDKSGCMERQRERRCFCKYPSEQLIAQDQLIYFPGMAACLKEISSEAQIQLYQCQQCKNTTRMFLKKIPKKIPKPFDWYYC